MNKVILIGRLTRDPEIRVDAQQNYIAKYSLAVERKFDREKTDFINCVAFGKQGEFTEKYLRKGMKISLVGRIQTGSYTDRNGNKVYTTDVVVEETEFCEKKESVPQVDASAYTKQNADGFFNIPDGIDDELPFE